MEKKIFMKEEYGIDLSFIKIDHYKKRLYKYLKQIFNQELEIIGILLFGSVAKNTARDDEFYTSDIDIIIICKNLPSGVWERKKKLRENYLKN